MTSLRIWCLFPTPARKKSKRLDLCKITRSNIAYRYEVHWVSSFQVLRGGGEQAHRGRGPRALWGGSTYPKLLHRPLFHGRQYRNIMADLCKAAKVRSFGYHAIRHHAASVLADSRKASMIKIKDFLRHRRVRTTEGYLHTLKPGLAEALNLLEEKKCTVYTGKRGSEGEQLIGVK